MEQTATGFAHASDARFRLEAIKLITTASIERYGDVTLELLRLLDKFKFDGARHEEAVVWMMAYLDGYLDGKDGAKSGCTTHHEVVSLG